MGKLKKTDDLHISARHKLVNIQYLPVFIELFMSPAFIEIYY